MYIVIKKFRNLKKGIHVVDKTNISQMGKVPVDRKDNKTTELLS